MTSNWAGNITFEAERVAVPASTAEVSEVVRAAVAAGQSVRALGSGHSFNRIADTSGVQVSTRGLRSPLRIDEDRRWVSIGAGTRYGELAIDLAEHGLALANLASLPHISIAGAVATGTHGSGNTNRSLAAAVAAIEFVAGDGEVVVLQRGDEGFDGAVVSLGALGVVTRIRLDVVPHFEVRQRVFENLPFAALLENFDEITGAGYSVSAFTTWAEPEVIDQVWVKQLASELSPRDFYGATPATEALHPIRGVSAVACSEQFGVAGPWYERLPHFKLEFQPSNGEELQSEYLIPRLRAQDALLALSSIADRIRPHLLVNEVRTIARDSLWLSPMHGNDAVGLHFTWKQDPEVAELLPLLDEIFEPLGGRPHWGKVFDERVAVAERYPRFGDFTKLVERYDPNGVFANDFTRCVLR